MAYTGHHVYLYVPEMRGLNPSSRIREGRSRLLQQSMSSGGLEFIMKVLCIHKLQKWENKLVISEIIS